MLLIKGAHVYAPKDQGINDVLIAQGKIITIAPQLKITGIDIKTIDGTGKYIVPGFIDNHVHVIGGGGESGFSSRVPEVMLSDFINNGITTCIGLLGTDGITRHPKDLYAKIKALNSEGMTAYMHTGSYGFPSVTITGNVSDDIVFIDKVIGVKIALADHRSSFVTYDELLRLASQARVAGMIAGKAGVVLAHMGDSHEGLDLVLKAVKESALPVKTIHPTHVSRQPHLLKQAFEYAKLGGYIDITASNHPEKDITILAQAKAENVPLKQITFSSDGYGSTSTYDDAGNLLSIGIMKIDKLLKLFQHMVKVAGYSVTEALPFFTSNVAEAFELDPHKGQIQMDSDADLLLLDGDWNLDGVIAKGKVMMQNKQILKKGVYEL